MAGLAKLQKRLVARLRERLSAAAAKPHKSNDDPTDPNDVISVRFTDSNGKRVASAHVYEDGNGKVVRW